MRRYLLVLGAFIVCYTMLEGLGISKSSASAVEKPSTIVEHMKGVRFAGPRGMVRHYQFVFFMDFPQVLPLKAPFRLTVKKSETETEGAKTYTDLQDISRIVMTVAMGQMLDVHGQPVEESERVVFPENLFTMYADFTAGGGVSLSGSLDKLSAVLHRIPPFLEQPRILPLQEPFTLTIKRSEAEHHDIRTYTGSFDIARVILTVSKALQVAGQSPKQDEWVRLYEDFSKAQGEFTAGYGLSLSSSLDKLAVLLLRMPPFSNNPNLLSVEPLETGIFGDEWVLSKHITDNYKPQPNQGDDDVKSKKDRADAAVPNVESKSKQKSGSIVGWMLRAAKLKS